MGGGQPAGVRAAGGQRGHARMLSMQHLPNTTPQTWNAVSRMQTRALPNNHECKPPQTHTHTLHPARCQGLRQQQRLHPAAVAGGLGDAAVRTPGACVRACVWRLVCVHVQYEKRLDTCTCVLLHVAACAVRLGPASQAHCFVPRPLPAHARVRPPPSSPPGAPPPPPPPPPTTSLRKLDACNPTPTPTPTPACRRMMSGCGPCWQTPPAPWRCCGRVRALTCVVAKHQDRVPVQCARSSP